MFWRTLLEHAWVPLLVSQKSTIIPLGRPVHRARQTLLGDALLCVGLMSGHRDTYSDPDPQGRNVPVTLEPCVDDPKTTECMNAWVWNTDRFRDAQSRWPLSGIALWPSAGPRTTYNTSYHLTPSAWTQVVGRKQKNSVATKPGGQSAFGVG